MIDVATLPAAFISLLTSFGGSLETLSIQTVKGQVTYQVEVADSPLSQSIGLMYRSPLAENQGMLFIYDTDRQVQFWMKGVSFPLDMIFFDNCGRIAHIHHNAVPFDTTVISPPKPVRAVLEIAGGASKSAQMRIGDLALFEGGESVFSSCPSQ